MKDQTALIRCDWANRSALETSYHDRVWGVPLHDDLELFKMLMLESQQAGLSWSTILAKMDTLCEAYDNFDPHVLVKYGEDKVEELLHHDGVIKNKLKIKAVIHNSHQYFMIVEQYGSLNEFFWSYVNHQPIINQWKSIAEVPGTTTLSDQISKDLKKLGFKFVGSTTVYAFMQSVGMVNDHLVSCAFYNGPCTD